MKRKCGLIIACFLILALLTTLGIGCGDVNGGGKVTITIGQITDMTGPAGPAYRSVTFALEDQIRHINEDKLIPGVTLELVTYDTGYDPSKDIPGYEWCKQRGAKVIYAGLPSAGVFKPFAERDKTPVVTLAVSMDMVDPPGWLFCMNAPVCYQTNAFLNWLSEQWPNYPTRPKIGSAGWAEPYHVEITRTIEQYAKAHSDKFEYVAGPLAPYGSVTWASEVEQLKGCDYVWVPSTGLDTVTFVQQYRDSGGTATFIGGDAMAAFRGLLLSAIGWQGLDGSISVHASTRWWGEPYPIVESGEELLNKYHANEADDIIRSGIGYIGGFHQAHGFLDALQKAIEKVGAESFNGQAFYDTAAELKVSWDGYEPWGFTQTKRYAWDYVGIYKWSKAKSDLVRFVPEWIPNMVD